MMNENEDFEGFEDIPIVSEDEDNFPNFEDDGESIPTNTTKSEDKATSHKKPTEDELPILDFNTLYKKIMIRIVKRLEIIHNITYQDRIKLLAGEIGRDLELLDELIKLKLGGE
ncbi:DUF5102 domain-containing protein [Methanocaldococcus fervens]|nr:DUF5102 domain-containing protein [Methanocaldococcus fervens]